MKQFFNIHAVLLCVAMAFASCADDNFDYDTGQVDRGVSVSFNVSSAQDEMLMSKQSMNTPATRAATVSHLAAEGLTIGDLSPSRHEVKGAGDVCIIETTLEGVNPVLPSADTRAQVKTSIDGAFSSSGYRSNVSGFSPDKPEWFCGEKTNANGTLVSERPWSWNSRYGRFYAVYPYDVKAKMSDATYSGTPYVEFEVEKDVKNQKDLMTACSGEVSYSVRGTSPQTNLKFYHALTAIRFAVGQNLSWNKHITKVEIKQAYKKGRYSLPTEFDAKGSWITGSLSEREDFVLDLTATPVNIQKSPNTVIMGNPTDNYTFYMIPQDLAGVTLVITLADNDPAHPSSAPNTITIPFTKGKWLPGTSKLYKLSQNASDWTYNITVTKIPAAADYNQSTSDTYGITSIRTAPDGTTKAAEWKVKDYSTDGGVTWTNTPPTWLKGLSLKEGGKNFNNVGEEQGTATLKDDDITDFMAERNAKLRLNEKGSASQHWNLANPTTGSMNSITESANCYVISSPGYYAIPIVYGNSIKNNAINTSAYQSSLPAGTPYALKTFKDHNGSDIYDPKIGWQLGGGPDDATIVWMDHPNLVRSESFQIVHGISTPMGSMDYLEFEVKKEDIFNGNAVIAVRRGGAIAWSWHLWFAPDDVLETVKCTNYQGKDYSFTKENLGWRYTSWKGTTYQQPRSVIVRIEQLGGTKKQAVFTVTQNPGNVRQGYNTYYQYGRKDAFPGTDDLAPGSSFNKNAGNFMSVANGISHPENFYTNGTSWVNDYRIYNLWSMNDVTNSSNDNIVVKTIYDPCPAGFKMPASNAFTGFTKTGKTESTQPNANVSGDWDDGFNFNNKIVSPDKTIYFPSSDYRFFIDGTLNFVKNSIGAYWTATTLGPSTAYSLTFTKSIVQPASSLTLPYGAAVRPVAE